MSKNLYYYPTHVYFQAIKKILRKEQGSFCYQHFTDHILIITQLTKELTDLIATTKYLHFQKRFISNKVSLLYMSKSKIPQEIMLFYDPSDH